MRRALARLLGLALTLALTSVVALPALTQLARRSGLAALSLPLYFNPTPRNVHDLSKAAVQRLAAGEDSEAARELVRLGGAALPHVLPALDTLAPSARGRVALALVPVARRMGIGAEEELGSPAGAAAFWARFWQDRAFDFRPQIVRRLVTRLAQRARSRRDDILQVDTYALPELIRALGRIRTPEDVLRAERITALLAHVLEQGPVARRGMTIAEARAVARSWQNFWIERGSDFVTLDGPTRVAATLLQTRYGLWVAHALGVLKNRSEERGGTFGIAGTLLLASAGRALAAMAGGVLVAGAWTRWELTATRRKRLATRAAASLLLAAQGALLVIPLNANAAGFAREALSLLLTTTLAAAVLSRPARVALGRRFENMRPALRDAWRGALSGTPAALPWLLSGLFYAEVRLALAGAAPAVLAALDKGDVAPGMTVALAGALLSSLLVLLGDRSATWPVSLRSQPALVEVDPRRHHRLLAWAAALIALLALLAAGVFTSGADGRALASGARALLGYGTLAALVSFGSGLTLGALAASGPSSLENVILRAVEIAGAMPTLLWAAALAAALGDGVGFAIALGLLRGIDVGWLLRNELTALARADRELGVRSLGHLPLVAYVRGRLVPAAMPAVTACALMPAWLLGVSAAARAAGFAASAGGPGWDALFAGSGPTSAAARGCALLLTALTTGSLLAAAAPEPRRLGAARSGPVSERFL